MRSALRIPDGFRRVAFETSGSVFACDTTDLIAITGFGKSPYGPFLHVSVVRPGGVVDDADVARVRDAFFEPDAVVCEYRSDDVCDAVHLAELLDDAWNDAPPCEAFGSCAQRAM